MFKKLFLFLFFSLCLYKYAYAGFTVLGVAGFFGGSAFAVQVVTVAYWIGVVAVLGYSVYAYVAANQQKNKLKNSDSRYSSTVINNTFSNETYVPIIYGGPIIMGGNIVWQSDPGTTVQRFLAVGLGELGSIDNVQVDEQDISTLSGCSYTAYLGTSTQTPDSRCAGVVKGLRDIANIAVTITSGEKVSSDPVVSCHATGRKIKTWNSVLRSWDVNGLSSSKNPAAIMRDYLLLSSTVGGCGISENFIDNESFGEVSEQCDEPVDNGNGGTEPRYEMTIVLDTKDSVLDNLAKMQITFNAALIRSGPKYKLVIEKSSEVSVMAFTEDNITKGTFTYGYGKVEDTPNKLIVEWMEALEYSNPKRTSWAEDELDQEVNGIREEKIEALGIIRQSQANRLANKILYDRKINDVWCEFEANMSAMHCEPYDIVSVTHSMPNWTSALFRILEITEANFGKAKFLCQSYNGSILNDSYGSAFSTWDYGSPPNPYEPITDVTNITLVEVGWLNSDGVWVINIDVSWTAPASKKELLRNYIIELKTGSDDYVSVSPVPASATSYRINGNLKSGETYYVKIKTQSVNDIISDGIISNPITIVGKNIYPSNVENFSYSWGKNLDLNWRNVTDSDLRGYEIRDEDANFGTDDSHLIYRGLANRKILTPSSRAPGHYYIRAINSGGKCW